MSKGKNSIWPRIAYACGTFGHDVFYAMLATYFMIFVTSNLFRSDDTAHDAYMIGIVTTIILVLRIAELFIVRSLAISLIRPKPAGDASSLGLSSALSLPPLRWLFCLRIWADWPYRIRRFI